MSLFSVCPDDPVLKAIRQKYSATPLKTPETRVRPLSTFRFDKKSKRADFLGDLNPLLVGPNALDFPVDHSDLADLTGLRTRKLGTNLGLDILKGLLQKLGGSGEPLLDATLNGVKQLSFSFKNVKRDYIDVNKLGSMINKFKLNLDNANLYPFKAGGPELSLLFIDSVLTTSEFNVHRKKENDAALGVNEGVLSKLAAQVNANLKVEMTNETDVTFTSPQPLSFAATSLPLLVDWTTGIILGFGQSADTLKHLGVEAVNAQAMIGTPDELLSWDN